MWIKSHTKINNINEMKSVTLIDSHCFLTTSDAGLSLFRLELVWQLVKEASRPTITTVSKVSPTLICISTNHRDIEYISLKDLSTSSIFADYMLGRLIPPSPATEENMGATVIRRMSSNALMPISLMIGSYESRMLLTLNKPTLPPIADQQRIAALLLICFFNSSNLSDLTLLLKDSTHLGTQFSFLVMTTYLKFKRLNGAVTDLIFEKGGREVAILLHYTLSVVSPQTPAHRNSFSVLELLYIRDLFTRAALDPITVEESLFSLITASPANHKMISFRKGSLHHIAALCLWIQSFCAQLIKELFIYYTNDSMQQISPWLFLLDKSCRNSLIELLLLVKIYNAQLKALATNSEQGSNEMVYVKELEIYLMQDVVQIDHFIPFLLQVGHLQSQSGLLTDFQLLFTGTPDSAYRPLIQAIKPIFEPALPNLYGLTTKQELVTRILGATRWIDRPMVDAILKTNIRDGSLTLLNCGRCHSMTQTSISMDEVATSFQDTPAWNNAYQDKCICGGEWK